MLERLQKILSAAGIASRRKSEELILQRRVKVNGSVATLGQKADYGKDLITLDGNRISIEKKKYLLLYKPAGFVTTTEDRFAKRKVVDLVSLPERVYPVGRLDANAEGLLVLTNDGEFANRLMHPRYEVEKTYVVKLKRKLAPEDAERIGRGVFVEGRRVAAKIKLLQKDLAEITVHEGRHKIVKRLFKEVGNYVLRITRTRIGAIGIGKLRPGMWRELTSEEKTLLTSGSPAPANRPAILRRRVPGTR